LSEPFSNNNREEIREFVDMRSPGAGAKLALRPISEQFGILHLTWEQGINRQQTANFAPEQVAPQPVKKNRFTQIQAA
jgi:hypothetical protein